MNLIWQTFLTQHGAIIAADRVAHFGDAAAELRATQNGTVICDLSYLSLLQFAGDDATAFLQGQLSCDVNKISSVASANAAQYGGYCTPKGRLLMTFLLWKEMASGGKNDAGYLMQLPGSLREAMQKRLSMFVMRSKVKVADSSDAWVRLGVAGNNSSALVEKAAGHLPGADLSITASDTCSVLRLANDRYEILAAPERAGEIWDALNASATPVGAACWDWLEINACIPTITAATQEEFIPQMVNLEAIGGVSFKKGCYPGQEIVARTQYLGKLKRRMYLARINTAESVAAGDALFGADMNEQASGIIVNAAPAPGGGVDVLAVIQTSSVEANSIHWKTRDGAALKMLPLPYTLVA